MRHLVLVLAFWAVAVGAAAAPDAAARRGMGLAPAALYEQVAAAVVGLASRKGSDAYTGTGTIIDPSGLVLTSITAVPEGAVEIRVYLRGGRELRGRLLAIHVPKELVLVRIEAPEGGAAGALPEYPFVKLGDSSTVGLGEEAYTLGNAFGSIAADDQVTFGEGVLSGFYHIREYLAFEESRYVGPVIETSAAVNGGMDGGPLLDGQGQLIGLLSLSYSRNRWLGTAIPINDLKPLMAPYRGWFSDRDEDFAAYAGLELEEIRGSEVSILRVHPSSPAAAAGLEAGERIVAVGARPLGSVKDFREVFARERAGGTLEIETVKEGRSRRTKLSLWGRF